MKYSMAWLLEQHQRGEKLKYVFFWGHQPKKDGSVGESCFSQWWVSPFTVGGVEYRTAEHWMMAQKARLFNDPEHARQVLASASPAQAKKIGRLVEGFDGQVWDRHKYEYVREGNSHKFSQHPALREFLLNTKDRVLVEASPVDKIWGIGMAKTDEHIHNPARWKGENLLGFALMEVRDALRQLSHQIAEWQRSMPVKCRIAVLVAWREGVASRLPFLEGLGGGFTHRLHVRWGSAHSIISLR